ncbi:MAG: NADP-dependent malic enzyme, partial [Oscillospiraceae bacterium]|nr:NADP-dependent malic enzyme [Oscillospiraceae bacterium]
MHRKWAGKQSCVPKMNIESIEDLSLVYTPGVAAPCLEIAKNPSESYGLTGRRNLVAVITDGSAVLGLGDIGPEAAMPVMEGKCVLFKAFGGVDAIPICLRTKDTDEFVRTVFLLSGSFGGINLEDISAPRCFEIERKLKRISDIPVFHDDQHGTATVVLAAITNALKLAGKTPENAGVVINGAGAAGISVAHLLLKSGFENITVCDRNGAIYEGRPGLNPAKEELSRVVNRNRQTGGLRDVIKEADVFIGLSAQGAADGEMIRSMSKNAVVFALANPVPEIMPDEAARAGAFVVGTGRSDFPNQINNALAFPGIFRGALDSRASDINEEMMIGAAGALAELASETL